MKNLYYIYKVWFSKYNRRTGTSVRRLLPIADIHPFSKHSLSIRARCYYGHEEYISERKGTAMVITVMVMVVVIEVMMELLLVVVMMVW